MKTNQRLFNLSIAKKISNGLIRNGHDVLEISDRDFIIRYLIIKISTIKLYL